MPGTPEGAIGIVIMEEVAALGDDPPTEGEESAAQLPVPSQIERHGCERSIAGPHVAIRIAAKLEDVRVGGREHSAVVIDLGPDYEEAAGIEPLERRWQGRHGALPLHQPGAPVVRRA